MRDLKCHQGQAHVNHKCEDDHKYYPHLSQPQHKRLLEIVHCKNMGCYHYDAASDAQKEKCKNKGCYKAPWCCPKGQSNYNFRYSPFDLARNLKYKDACTCCLGGPITMLKVSPYPYQTCN